MVMVAMNRLSTRDLTKIVIEKISSTNLLLLAMSKAIKME